jgi:uncharacterized protein YjiS (DUF1127 family)
MKDQVIEYISETLVDIGIPEKDAKQEATRIFNKYKKKIEEAIKHG